MGEFEPLGRLAFVKLANPDMYPGHPHSRLLAEYARSHGSKCVLVVHYGGSSNYRSYMEGDILILQLAYVEKNSANRLPPQKEENKRVVIDKRIGGQEL